MSRRYVAISVPLLLLVVLNGCLSIDTVITFDDRESGTIEVVYSIDREHIVDDRVASPPGMLPLPVSEEDVRRVSHDVGNLELERYSTSVEGNKYIVETRLSFSSLEALNAYYGVNYNGTDDTERAVFFEGDSYHQMVFKGFDEPLTGDDLTFLEAAFPDASLGFCVVLPEEIIDAHEGEQVDTHEARWEILAEDVASVTEPLYWTIEVQPH